MNYLSISFHVVIEFNANELSQSLAAPFKEKGNNLRLIFRNLMLLVRITDSHKIQQVHMWILTWQSMELTYKL